MWGLFKRKSTKPEAAATPEPSAAPAELPLPSEGAAVAQTPAAAGGSAVERSWLARLKEGLAATRDKLGLTALLTRGLDEATLEALETQLLMADCGMAATQHLLEDLRRRWKSSGGRIEPRQLLVEALTDLLAPLERRFVVDAEASPYVIMISGVNGAGKTTSIGKLAKLLQSEGASVLLAAGDTFRAAAREQLAIWGERNNVAVIQQQGGDPSAVMFDAVNAGRARGIDVVICDTAGRLPTQLHLMEELKKAKRAIAKAHSGAPHEILLVLDGTTGQNALAQVKAFDEALALTGLIMTKLDGSAKGGAICAIAKERPVPLCFIGVGEGIDDLRPFSARAFAEALV
ncbi:MAG: signal recognition particle-docking protein FtsY [Casimicrobiaceae bacterium]|nr:signal recognition particle-docking protein FtsY [Casimicrobiaceae bacterium]MCX8098560.1 signal recognition particle-docking protein FtsY [Casimicrobiaceae bacterium]